MIQEERIQTLRAGHPRKGRYILYWMQASQRAEYNHALEFAILKANEMNQPLVVFFGLTDDFPEANDRHYYFMLQGLKATKSSLEANGIRMVIHHGRPDRGAVTLAGDASLVVVDRGYLKVQKAWRRYVAGSIRCPLIQVETDVVVPVEAASPKEEYAAATIRSKIATRLDRFLLPLKRGHVRKESLGIRFDAFDIDDVDRAIGQLKIDRSVGKTDYLKGGTSEAKKHLAKFLKHKLHRFAELRNDPTVDYLSNMSPYLHFGQISPVYVALKVKEAGSAGTAAYLEELIIRRELSMNFVNYNRTHDSFSCLPAWARKTLTEHKKDKRVHIYTLKQLEDAKTHDRYWNAAQQEMLLSGKMHGYMRMYWGKKILEWTGTPEHGFKTALYLNNKYELDGRDPNGFAGVAWCFGKHDRPWAERSVFGKVRYMNDKGLRRKFDADAYADRIEKLASEHS
jgi:deoxyribodipyrimidine photo-lyase